MLKWVRYIFQMKFLDSLKTASHLFDMEIRVGENGLKPYVITSEGRDTSVDLATCNRLDCPLIVSLLERGILHSLRLALGSTRPPVQRIPGHSLG